MVKEAVKGFGFGCFLYGIECLNIPVVRRK